MTMVRHTVRKYPATFALYLMCIGWHTILAQEVPEVRNLTLEGELGKEASLSCSLSPENATVEWLFNGEPLKIGDRIQQRKDLKELPKDRDGNRWNYQIANITISNITLKDEGNYTCVSKLGEAIANRTEILDLSYPGELVNMTLGPIEENVTNHANVSLKCVFQVYKPGDVTWRKIGNDDVLQVEPGNSISPKEIESTYVLQIKNAHEDNGTYVCDVFDRVTSTNIKGSVDVIIYAKPQVFFDVIKPISSSELFLNWTVSAYNSPITNYSLMVRQLPSTDFNYYTNKHIGVTNTSLVMQHLNKSTSYQLRLGVHTHHGNFYTDGPVVKTLDNDPIFVPEISINGFSATSVTIAWAPPPDDIAEYIHYYLLEARKKNESAPKRAYHSRDNRNLPYMFDNLQPHSTYVFRVCACSEYTKKCGNWSKEMEAITLDGTPERPSKVKIHCNSSNHIFLTWEPPLKPNAEIKGYTMELTGNATYKDRYGNFKLDTWGPLSKFKPNNSRYVRFDDLRPNTNYTVRISAMTRTRRRGEEVTKYCATKPAPPDSPPRPHWRKIMENDRYMFKMNLPRVSERNGALCCYRVYMVRLPANTDWNSLPLPKDMNVYSYEEAHSVQVKLGAYITDVFSNNKFPPDSVLIMGDGATMAEELTSFDNDVCRRCLLKPNRSPPEPLSPVKPTVITTSTTTTTTFENPDDPPVTTATEAYMEAEKRDKRSYSGGRDGISDDDRITPNDGPLDSTTNYTLFVELIPGTVDDEPLFSEYLNALMAAPSPPIARASTTLEIALQVTCAIAALVLLAMVVFCIRQTRRSRKLPPHAHVEMNPIQAALRYVVGHIGGRQQLISSVPPDLPPIAKEDLAAAYAERQVDSDYGFQKEFELLQMLPECFPDRTTHASEARENQPKNRYPDIKAYDQTRVKLSQIDSVTGSDYINANYVMGYKERKQFICAQGPTETTVNDFWRMIWEHGLELIVMLTNLEEYSKVKCSKYWPDEVRGQRAFGNITVHHVSEKRYSDYIVRELRITKQATTADGQPIVENNGIAKRNGECKDAETSSAPTSPREAKDTGTNSRIVRQYHFLMWKDFAAPEHPYSILKFIKRVNEAWCSLSGRPVVVHCSAGVGRTGTLVALDCLLDQLRAQGHAAVFNTVAELRRQRNFLVQSLKQYVFVYRALVEYAHYGDTEIPASRLKACIDRLRNTPECADKCIMEEEFEKMLNSPVVEPLKSCAAGAGDEVRSRNRSADRLPYDRNRVILTPVPGRDFSTYINASFIEAYDNSEGFIITQDPLPNTITDFWRMVSEHNVSTIVMLSELGEGKCPRYWDDGTAQYDHISVEYEESESCPYYTRRQFRVTNNKSGDVCSVRQLQYHGWPTAPGHVPEVTRGLAELADAADPASRLAAACALVAPGPMLVHCQYGTERSALFVALCILICQLRAERRVDVNNVARKVRSQRAGTIDTFLQYEFLHRAILNYAELHNLLEDS